MAKKKRTTSKSSPRATGKKTGPKPRAARPAGKSSARKSSSKKPATGSSNNSVDLLLKRFAKERAQKESQLESLRKNKQDLEDKARKFQEQITKLAQQEKETQSQLAQLDKQRDQEVSQLLSKLGIQLGGNAAASPAVSREPHAKPADDRIKHAHDRAVPTPNGRNEKN
jgi:hypothetical protein